MCTRWTLLAVAGVVSFMASASACVAQERADSGVFVVRLGHDTTAIERYLRSGDTVKGTIVTRSPGTRVAQYVIALAPDGTVRAVGVARDGEELQMRPAPVAGGIAVFAGSYVPYQLAVQRAAAAGGDSTDIVMIAGDDANTVVVRRIDPSTYRLPNQFDVEMTATVDAEQRITRVEVAGGTTVERAPWLDIDRIAGDFRARDAAGTGLGPLSPRDTTSASVGGATIEVDYGRPSLRGRELSQLAPNDQVWRTGANAETQLTTDRPLVFGSLTVAAGTYSLFTIPSASSWTLILNREIGQGGLEYNAGQDVGRIEMQTGRDGPHTEQLTIDVEESAGGGVLTIRWGTLVARAPFSVGTQ
jgi:hypothetical protein